MTWWMYTNLKKVNEWKLKQRTILVMGIFADLENWATPHKSNDATDNNIYYLLYREKILAELPFLGSVSTISRSIKELEDKGIIKSIHKNTTPAYCLTEKGLSWKKKPIQNKEANIGEADVINEKKLKPRKGFKFQLSKKTSIENLPDGYIEGDLYSHCMAIAVKLHLANGKEEYSKFLVHNSMTGGKWANWGSAFTTWCYKRKELDKKDTNIKNEGRGLYV